MAWRERDHPRDPKTGEFREKTTGWVGRLSDRIGLPSVKDLLANTPPNSSIANHDQVAAALEGNYGSGGMRVQNVGIHRAGGDYQSGWTPIEGHLNISGEIASESDPGNAQGGYFRATVSYNRESQLSDPLRWSAHLDRMHVRGDAQGGGGGRELTARLIDWFRQSGLDEVTVGPSEIGSYAWGAMGFDFQDHESRRIAWQGAMSLTPDSIRTSLDPRWNPDLPPLPDDKTLRRMIRQYQLAATRALAGTMSYQKLSQVGRRKGQDKDGWWAGKLGLIVGGVGGGRIKL